MADDASCWSKGVFASARFPKAGSPIFYLARAYQMSYVAFLVCGFLTSIQLNQSFWFMPAASVFLLQAARGEAAAVADAS